MLGREGPIIIQLCIGLIFFLYPPILRAAFKVVSKLGEIMLFFFLLILMGLVKPYLSLYHDEDI